MPLCLCVSVVKTSQMRSNFVPLGEPSGFQLRKHQRRIDGNLKSPAIGWNQHKLRKIAFQLLHDFFGQTGRFGFVVSNLAIDDFDFHGPSNKRIRRLMNFHFQLKAEADEILGRTSNRRMHDRIPNLDAAHFSS